ncbi:hypothetical protein [Oryzihumus sp.]|uniref:hypothetical protein n=1 Tax=Oryzihumus sp. TaxID=1968903 RepID=UPI002ED7ACB6
MPINPASSAGSLWIEAAPGYVAYDMRQHDEYDPPQTVIRRVSDGAPVRTLTWPPNENQPPLTPGGVVTLGSVPGQPGASRVTVTDPESGATTWTTDVPAAESLINEAGTWVLSRLGGAGGGQAILRRPGTDPVSVAGVTLSVPSSEMATASTATTLAIRDTGKIWTVDLSTGAAHQITAAAGWYDPMIVTPHRIFWIDEGVRDTDDVHWSDLDGSNPGVVTVSGTSIVRQWLAFGDRLAAIRLEDGDTIYSSHLEPLDPSAGAFQPAVASDVGTARSMGDGTVALFLHDTPTGRVVTLADDGQPVHQVAELPVLGKQVSALSLSNNQVAAWFGDAYAPGSGSVLVTAADGSTGWNPAPATGDDPMTGSLVAARGDVVLTDAAGPYNYSPHTFTARWPGGHRDVGQDSTLVLGRGGRVLVSAPDSSTVALDDVRTGDRLKTIDSTLPIAVDGWTLWRGPDANGNLVATDLSGTGTVRTVASGLAACPYPNNGFSYPDLQVAGRFALVACGSSYTVVDLDAVLAPQHIPWSPAMGTQLPQLGNGFVAWVHQTTDAAGTIYVVAQVQNLGPGGGTRLYGPLHGYYSLPNSMMTVDDGDSPRLVYADTTLLPRVVGLDWLTTAPATWQDQAAPTLTSLTGTPRVGGTSVSVNWSDTDSTDVPGELPSQVASYDVRYQQGPIGGAYGDWVQPAELQGTTATTAQLTATPGADTCFSVRARDHAGNVSDWSASRCSAADPTAPALQSTGGTPRVNGARQVSFSWSFTDPSAGGGLPGSGLASYDVRYQDVGTTGAPYGPWVYPPVWDHTTSTSATLQPLSPGQGACFQVRARDKAGNLAGWSASRCSAVDGTSPVITVASAGPLVIGRTSATSAPFSYRASDNVAVANYDVGYRYAPPGGTLGALQHPAAWQATTSTAQHVTLPAGGEVCYTVRARDRVGLVSPWASYRCATVPYDDRAMTGSSVTRTSSTLALSGTVSRLNLTGATLRAYHQSGAGVAVVVLRGPHQGAIDLYVGSRRVTRIYLSSANWHRDVITLPTGAFTNATITLRSATPARSLIDALAITR